jgi:lipopolysaccharide biosynthesis protein
VETQGRFCYNDPKNVEHLNGAGEMKRVVLFASYDKNGKIHDYVLGYLTYLKAVARHLLFIADNPIADFEQQKLTGLVDAVICEAHGAYDFGSYQRGYLKAKALGLLDEADELILCNDSCFCFRPLAPIFDIMAQRSCDVWAMTKSFEEMAHLQSFFLVVKRAVFESPVFIQHLMDVEPKPTFQEVVRCYELPFAQKLIDAAFVCDAYLVFDGQYNRMCSPCWTNARGLPLLKKKVFIQADHFKESFTALGAYLKDEKQLCNEVEAYFGCSRLRLLWRMAVRRLIWRLQCFFKKKWRKLRRSSMR